MMSPVDDKFEGFDRSFRKLHEQLRGTVGFTQEQFQEYLNRVGELLLWLIRLVGPPEYHLRHEMYDMARLVTVGQSLAESDHTRTNAMLLGLVRHARTSAALERAAGLSELLDLALLESLLPKAAVDVESLLYAGLDRFFRLTFDGSHDIVRTKLMANVEYLETFGEAGIARLFHATRRRVFERIKTALVQQASIKKKHLDDLLGVGTEGDSPDEQFNRQYARLWEIVTLRTHEFPLPRVIRKCSRETMTRNERGLVANQVMLLRWGHTQLTFVWYGDRLESSNVVLVNKLLRDEDKRTGRKMLLFNHCLTKMDGTLCLLELDEPVRVDYLYLHGLHPFLKSGEFEQYRVPMPWGKVLQQITYDKTVYGDIFRDTAVPFPRQVAWRHVQTIGHDAETIRMGVRREIINYLVSHKDIAEVVVKPASESGGRGVKLFPAGDIDGMVEWVYDLSRVEDVVIQERIVSPPLSAVVAKPLRTLFGREIDDSLVSWSARSIITRDANGRTVVPVKVILANVKGGVASMSQGAYMFMMEDIAPDLPLDLLERLSGDVLEAAERYARSQYADAVEHEPLDGGSYLSVDCLLLDWLWNGSTFVHIEPNIGLGTFWYHDQIVGDDVKGMGVIHMLRNGERRALAYAAAVEQGATAAR
jgi:hypothetical protein